jgi:hypothetical protein
MFLKTSRNGQPSISSIHKKAFETKAEILDGGEWWCSPIQTARYLGVTPPTVKAWTISCDWIDGDGIETRPLKGMYGRTFEYRRKVTLDRIRAAQALLKAAPTYPGLTHLDVAAAELGISTESLRLFLAAAAVKIVKKSGKGKGRRKGKAKYTRGRVVKRPYVPTDFIKTCQADRDKARVPANAVTISGAARMLKVSRGSIFLMIADGDLVPLPAKVAFPYQWHRRGKHGSSRQVRDAFLLDKVSVENARNGHASETAAGQPTRAEPATDKPRRRGRQPGFRPQSSIERRERIRKDAKTGKYSRADIARRQQVSPSLITKVLGPEC